MLQEKEAEVSEMKERLKLTEDEKTRKELEENKRKREEAVPAYELRAPNRRDRKRTWKVFNQTSYQDLVYLLSKTCCDIDQISPPV